jgi:adenylyltransferase/sulfurtransferase
LYILKLKPPAAEKKINASNPNVSCIVFTDLLQESNAENIISQFDIIVDGSDNFLTRYLVNDVCVSLNKPLVYGSILKFAGQLAVFNYKGGKNLRDVYPEAPDPGDVPSCDQNGVMGFVPGIIGIYMASAAIQIILDIYDNNSLILFNFSEFSVLKLEIA